MSASRARWKLAADGLSPAPRMGADGLREFIERMRAAYPHGRYEVKRMFADGDYVVLHVHVVREPGTRGSAHVDSFRLDDGKVAEHWDLDEPIPVEIANPRGPF